MMILTTENFDNEIKNAELPVVVDFWAEWCGPCKRLEPILALVSDKLNGIATIAKVNIDDNMSIAERYSIKSIPTLMIFNKGEFVGAFIPSGTSKDIAETIVTTIKVHI